MKAFSPSVGVLGRYHDCYELEILLDIVFTFDAREKSYDHVVWIESWIRLMFRKLMARCALLKLEL